MTHKRLGLGRTRIEFLDNVRTFVIFLVVVFHAGWVYESSGIGAFFWLVDDYSSNQVADVVNLILDIYIMSTLFFVSGYLAYPSLVAKGWYPFIRSRFRRIMVPWLVAVVTLVPMYKFIFLYSRNIPQEDWTSYFHFNNGIFSQSWLWFLPLLFLFNMVFVLFTKMRFRESDQDLRNATLFVFSVGFLYSVGMDMFSLSGWTKTMLLDFQNERILIYFLYFLLGAICFKKNVFQQTQLSKRFYLCIFCTLWIPLSTYVFLTIHRFLHPDSFVVSKTVDMLICWSTFHLSLMGLLYLTLNTFRFFLPNKGKIGKILSDNAYGVYIIHVIIIGLIATSMLSLALGSLVKYAILALSTFLLCNLMVFLYQILLRTKIRIRSNMPTPNNRS